MLAHAPTRLGVGPRQTKEQQGTERIDIAAHARLTKTILLGRRIGTRAKLNGIGIGSIAYTIIAICTGKFQKKDIMVAIIGLLFCLKFIFITM